MNPSDLFRRYQELQQYVGWTDEDAERVRSLSRAPGSLPAAADRRFLRRDRSATRRARKVITGGQAQIDRLKGTLVHGCASCSPARTTATTSHRRWRVGWRHVEIGLDQVYTNVALSRLRGGLLRLVLEHKRGDLQEVLAIRGSLNKLLDLDLAIIEDAYQAEYLARQQRAERLAAIGQVAGGVAHELRNPLNVVKTSVYYLLNARQPTAAKTAEHLQRIERHVTVADGVITALSNFAKMPLPNLQPFAVSQCVQEALELNPLPENVAGDPRLPGQLARGPGRLGPGPHRASAT